MSKVLVGRTIGEKREKLETKNERVAARKKDKQKKSLRIAFSILGFLILIIILVILARSLFNNYKPEEFTTESTPVTTEPTIEIVDESASTTGGKITNRMREYIGQLESDLRSYNLTPLKAVIRPDSIREVDLYLDGYTGFIKTVIDRSSAVTAEDTDRMLRYLAGQGIADFEYIDVRIDGRAFWK